MNFSFPYFKSVLPPQTLWGSVLNFFIFDIGKMLTQEDLSNTVTSNQPAGIRDGLYWMKKTLLNTFPPSVRREKNKQDEKWRVFCIWPTISKTLELGFCIQNAKQ